MAKSGLVEAARATGGLWSESLTLEVDVSELNELLKRKEEMEKKDRITFLDQEKTDAVRFDVLCNRATPQMITDVIMKMDTTALSETFLALLTSLLKEQPNQAELCKLENYSGKVEELEIADQVFLALRKVPRWEQRSALMVFMAERAPVLREWLSSIFQMSEKIQQSEELKFVLLLVKEIRNNLLEGTISEPLTGIAIRDLDKVTGTPGLMRFVCKVLSAHKPDVLGFWKDFMDGPQSLRALAPMHEQTIQDMVAEVNSAKEAAEREQQVCKLALDGQGTAAAGCATSGGGSSAWPGASDGGGAGSVGEFTAAAYEVMQGFLETEVIPTMNEIQILIQKMEESTENLSKYFGGDSTNSPPELILTKLHAFVALYKENLAGFERKQQKYERQEERGNKRKQQADNAGTTTPWSRAAEENTINA